MCVSRQEGEASRHREKAGRKIFGPINGWRKARRRERRTTGRAMDWAERVEREYEIERGGGEGEGERGRETQTR